MEWCKYLDDIIAGVFTVIAAVVAVGGAVFVFYRQKEHELVQKRYLDEGIDVVIATAEQALNIYSHNWARCTEILKSFRDLPTIKPEELTNGFITLPQDRFALTAHYRLNVIVDSQVIWESFQLVLSFSQRANTIVAEEIPLALKAKLTTQTIDATRQEMVDAAMKELEELNEESIRFHTLPGELHNIARLLEEQRFTFRGIRKLNKHEVVRGVVSRLSETFSDKLSANAA